MRLGKKKDKDKEAEIRSVDGITRLICLSKGQAPLKGKISILITVCWGNFEWNQNYMLSSKPVHSEKEFFWGAEYIWHKILNWRAENSQARPGLGQSRLNHRKDSTIQDFMQNIFWNSEALFFNLQRFHWKYLRFCLKLSLHSV